mgnify:CR=1 FL=1
MYVFLVREYPNFIDFHQKIWHLYYQKKMLVVIKYWNVFSGLVERKICSNTSPCKANEGKCILDSHCKDGLSCIKNKCNSLFINTAIEHTGNISRGFLLVLSELYYKKLTFRCSGLDFLDHTVRLIEIFWKSSSHDV